MFFWGFFFGQLLLQEAMVLKSQRLQRRVGKEKKKQRS